MVTNLVCELGLVRAPRCDVSAFAASMAHYAVAATWRLRSRSRFETPFFTLAAPISKSIVASKTVTSITVTSITVTSIT
eukprot:2750651-Rhodomonas_salina.1